MLTLTHLTAAVVALISFLNSVTAETQEIKNVKIGKYCDKDSDCLSNFCFYKKCVQVGETSKGGQYLRNAYLSSLKKHDEEVARKKRAKRDSYRLKFKYNKNPGCNDAPKKQLQLNYQELEEKPCAPPCLKKKFVKVYPGKPDIMIV